MYFSWILWIDVNCLAHQNCMIDQFAVIGSFEANRVTEIINHFWSFGHKITMLFYCIWWQNIGTSGRQVHLCHLLLSVSLLFHGKWLLSVCKHHLCQISNQKSGSRLVGMVTSIGTRKWFQQRSDQSLQLCNEQTLLLLIFVKIMSHH